MPEHIKVSQANSARFRRRLLWGLGAMVLLLPLGIWLPALLDSGTAWSEWSAGRLGELLGYVPEGLGRLSEIWKAPASEYGQADGSGGPGAIKYILSGALGVGAVAVAVLVLGRLLRSKDDGEREGEGGGDGRDS